MNIPEMIKSKKFIVTTEVSPPKGTRFEEVLRSAADIGDYVDAVNVTDCPSAVMRMGSTTLSYLLRTKGIEPVVQLVCRNRYSIWIRFPYSRQSRNLMMATT